MEFELKMVIVVRKDLKLSPGKMAAQVAHAAVNCALASKKRRPINFDRWYSEGQKKVVLKAQDLNELIQIKQAAEDAGLVTSLITDAGLTELPPNTTTCLGIGPAPNAEMDRITGHLGLM
ncbi:MAG TPA: peptidyl-tRNA hydrolase Pth2 [Methanomassiliicoccales archaeon]|jgi:PTH2 family peptidyl-tRNA hydrolase|nr:peptidyl-tRNA hydrolase Pth2 [Methanomassiliicoccales archaeon]MCE5260427.1 peptidyl-tRNA hydrolase Pth2 [Euryarchaeota archaeon]HOE52731.1 peptidyl-tRNA hydrolase Pth2 [Methanomassiliicoccales archaeon]HOO03110.1 peptidyl-tRNA hydrolase Pth2 [Methanomassiliicoccales archaeon]HPD08361.1 peptidyl-tRNA hydrolase Pth2 [Methanomassiliicoccales archaeon]